MLSVRLFGPPALYAGELPVVLPRRKSRALAFYLAAQSQPVRREALLALFWPEAERAAAQQTLRTTLHGLRKVLGEALVGDEETLALAPAVAVDARQLEAGLRAPGEAAGLAAVLALYRGDFLDGFDLPDAPAFAEWAAAERERYRRLVSRGLTALSLQHEARQDYGAALTALEQALTFDPLQEDIQRAALRLHYLAGDRAGAIRRYEQLRRLLDDELGVPPMAETRALYDAIITDTLARGPARPAVLRAAARPAPTEAEPAGPERGFVPPFTGRAAELAALHVLAAGNRVALLEGEPGIGKSRLAAEFLRTTDALPLVGAARELEYALPYQPVREALRSLLVRPEWPAWHTAVCAQLPAVWQEAVARLLPELNLDQPAPAAAPDESRLWEGVFQLLAALGQTGRRLIVFLDDLQWADASTLSLVGYLARRAEALRAPIFFLAAARPFEARSPLAALVQALTRDGRLSRLPLTRLAGEDVLALARRLSASFAQPLADWLRQNSEGNPLILAELVRELQEQGTLRTDGVVNLSALPAAPLVPQSVFSLVQSRLTRLSEPARRVLDAAVAAGREFEFDVVSRAAGLSEGAALDALDELRAAHLVLPAPGGQFQFDHSLTMEVAYREVGEPRHRLMHRRVAEAMESLGRDRAEGVAAVLAWHFNEGGAPERAWPYAFRAGQQAARLAAWREAAAFYEQARLGAPADQQLTILTALGEAAFQAGHADQAAEVLQAALAAAADEPARQAALRVLLAQTRLNQGRYAEVIAAARSLLVEAGTDTASAITAELLWGTALSLEGADLDAAAQHLQKAEARLHASPNPDPARLAQAKFEQGSVAAQLGDLERAVAFYREALAVAQAHPPLTLWRVLALNNLAYHLHLLGRPEAGDYARRGLAQAREAGALNLMPFVLSTLGEILLAAGDLTAAEGVLTEGLELAEQLGNAERVAGITANLGRLALARGETALAIHRLSAAMARADALGTQHLSAQIRIWLAPLLPRPEARATVAEARAIAESGRRRRLLEDINRLEAGL